MPQFPSTQFTFSARNMSTTAIASDQPGARAIAPATRQDASGDDLPLPVGSSVATIVAVDTDEENPFVRSISVEAHARVSRGDRQALLSQRDPVEEEVARPVRHTDPDFVNCEYNVHDSIGAVFSKSLYEEREGEHVQGKIRARGGGERQWYEGAEVSYLVYPELLAGTTNIELINQIQAPGRCPPQAPVYTFGQVVWKRTMVPAVYGCKAQYDQEPYIIISQCFTTFYYVLMDAHGHIYPRLVSPEQLEPLRTAWTAARLPNNWNISKDVQAVLKQGARPRQY
jgi:hypothetical protein